MGYGLHSGVMVSGSKPEHQAATENALYPGRVGAGGSPVHFRGREVGPGAIAAGCCWVMQCNAPKPQISPVQLMPTTSRSGNRRASVASAVRSFGSLKVGTNTSPFAM